MTVATEEEIDRGDTFTPDTENRNIVELDDDLDADLLSAIVGEEVEGEVEEVEPEPVTRTTGSIPKARFDEVNNRAKALELELEHLRAATPVPVATPAAESGTISTLSAQLIDLRTKAHEAMMDGENEQMIEFSAQADKVNRQIAKEEMRIEREEERAHVRVQESVAATMAAIAEAAYARFPFLDVNKPETCDNDAVDVVLALRDSIAAKGVPLTEALQQAVDKFAKINRVTPAAPTKGDEVRKARELADRTKSAAASVSQPATHSSGERQTFKVDIGALSDSEYAKLPESVKARARGDLV